MKLTSYKVSNNNILLILIFSFGISFSFAQNHSQISINSQKGRLYFYWGWNWDAYSKSDIHFKGNSYDFTLENVVAKDRQSPFDFKTYFHPGYITIPQYNYKIGYYFKENWDISIGLDHMKYVVQTNQTVKINGKIDNSNSDYDGNYSEDDIEIKPGFLSLEHTDGLNYINSEIRFTKNIFTINKLSVNLKTGLGLGALLPRTDASLLNYERYDQFHLAGYGINSIVGLNFSFYNRFFFQSEFKSGFINMPDIRTTLSKDDIASQNFFFSQINIVFGGIINLNRKNQSN